MKIQDMLANKDSEVMTIGPVATLREALSTMVSSKVGALPVLDVQGDFVGIITERDLTRQVYQETTLEEVVVEDVMTRVQEITSGTLEDDIEYVMDAMTEGRFRHLPVVEDDRLIGIVSIGDVVKERLTEARREIGQLMDYIAGPGL